jgi:hypothetical protein
MEPDPVAAIMRLNPTAALLNIRPAPNLFALNITHDSSVATVIKLFIMQKATFYR